MYRTLQNYMKQHDLKKFWFLIIFFFFYFLWVRKSSYKCSRAGSSHFPPNVIGWLNIHQRSRLQAFDKPYFFPFISRTLIVYLLSLLYIAYLSSYFDQFHCFPLSFSIAESTRDIYFSIYLLYTLFVDSFFFSYFPHNSFPKYHVLVSL